MDLQRTLSLTSDALAQAGELTKKPYAQAVGCLTRTRPIIWVGVGKSGYIAQKAASTFRSFQIPSHYLHPSEASHGDLGAITKGCAVVVISNSGETGELGDVVHFCNANAVPLISVTQTDQSTLGRASTICLGYGRVEETCPNGLAPTTSTTVALALCDALAIGVAQELGRSPADFKKVHPGGKLGLHLRTVKDVMRKPPIVNSENNLVTAALAMTGEVAGIALVQDGFTIKGVVTDGDIRRNIGTAKTVKDAMSGYPHFVPDTALVLDAKAEMQAKRITKIFVQDSIGTLVGVVNLHDCG